jgi:hypothetical protein
MEKGELFRKAFHLCAPAFLVYYLVPVDAWGWMPSVDGFLEPREVLLLAVLAVVLAEEAIRLKMGWSVFGMRPYERGKMAAHAWAGTGLAIGFLLFPQAMVVAVTFGMAWVDPMMGFLRKRRPNLYPIVPILAYWAIASVALLAQAAMHPVLGVEIAFVAACAAVLCESPRLDHLDDDFLLLTVPLLTMWLAYHAFNVMGQILL